ncbi:putative fatty acyl-CoA reductase CG5065 [Contarinia nasturtii]|uniref:putative fatty acyl-CoA reductase CG5065 n=1 Tax=Contarinia nasturtii TaxID=265458 RepID=UPI0012D482D9|nr:putative fatty acyl-CoA reductase CG5065 [Contarinia nasturtii]XP_031619646.1 putative fatty acyl-CoA reductase CG5065 [Contarinia nasturtii]XP_031619647.1 putative fatty acyl-CoA reductase CG5065 [Contarinia nasturtii]XP_031619648.1 putative fatty acyl-CoA reductase CG5065 [Contarinia nasturtii]
MEHTAKVEALDSVEEDRVRKMYANRSILITGGTGFLGKVLIEKFLRTCPEIEKIYLLVRPKRGKQPADRLADIFSNVLFDGLKETRGLDTIVNQCHVISGDCSLPDLGISDDDRKLLAENVSIVYHCAATVRFDETLKRAVLLNTRGTKLMLELSKTFKKLALFCYVSTSYCHLNERLLMEKPYPAPADPHRIIKSIEWLDEDIVHTMTKQILGGFPNTYAFTKCLSEALVVEQMNEMPAVIMRPSIVIPIRYEPIPGWTDNINGPTGLLIGAGKGVLRSMYCNSSSYGDYLPVDYAVNGIMVSSWNFVYNKDYDRRVYHLVSSAEIKVSWKELIDCGRWIICNKLPLNGVVWYPGGSMKSNRLHHNICCILFHWIPAILIDCLLFCLRYPPVLCRVQRRIQKGFDVFEYYANNQWDFDNSNVLYMRTIINEIEAKRYAIEDKQIDMYEYFEHCIHAARLYILKESDETIPAARRHMKVMYCVDRFVRILMLGLFIYYVGGAIFGSFFSTSSVLIADSIVDTLDANISA